MSDAPLPARTRVWDLPTRLFHWLVVLLVPAMWATHELEMMDVHILLGQVMLGLVLFRIFWGLLGSSTARFAGFVKGPAGLFRHLRGRTQAGLGHNPLGGWSVMLMLLLLLAQAGLGLFATDEDGLVGGPLSHLVSYETARTLAHRHETIFYILLAVIALHVAAILYYLIVRRDDLVTPMITGSAPARDDGAAMAAAPWWRFALALALAAASTLAIANLL